MRGIYALPAMLFVALIGTAAVCQAPAMKLVSTGDFSDNSGSVHTWKVNGAHTLIWDGQPYIPIGGVFNSKYVCLDQTEENWQADVGALELIKNKGITDLLLAPTGPITSTKPVAWQKLIDYLDSSGFTYGIDLNDGPKQSVNGVDVEPSRYRVLDAAKDSSFTFDIPRTVAAFWVLVNSDGVVLGTGGAVVSDGKVKVQLKTKNDQPGVLILYPRIEFSDTGDGMPNVWDGFDEYRDRLIGFFSGLKFGKGLRFFVDPISGKLDFSGQTDSIVPRSPGFRLEFESYLTRKYQNIGSLNGAWSLAGDHLNSFEQAARMIPLWHGTRGVPVIYDQAGAERHKVDGARSRIWEDIAAFRRSSVQAYMNSAADIVKRNGANVPVIYRASGYDPVFLNSSGKGGFDGLGAESYGHGEALVGASAGPIYSLAEESPRTTWFVVTGTQDTPKPDKAAAGYSSTNEMFADLDSLAEIGAKAIFTYGLQVLPEEAMKKHSLAAIPEQLDWLHQFTYRFVNAERVDYAPKAIYYPSALTVGAVPMRLAPGAWWLPSVRSGSIIALGDTIGAYMMSGQNGICMWSRTGPMTMTLPAPPDRKVEMLSPVEGAATLASSKGKVTVKLGDSPVVLSGLVADQVFPFETASAEIEKLVAAIADGKAAKVPTAAAEADLIRARDMLKKGLVVMSYNIAHGHVLSLDEETGSQEWIEGENPIASNLGSVASTPKASAGGYMKLDTAADPPVSPYTATYTFSAGKQGDYSIWVAGLGPGGGASPMSYSLDNGPWQQATFAEPTSAYGNGFAWYNIGRVSLNKGQHIVQIKADSKGSLGVYKAAIDVLVFGASSFRPNGITKP